MVNGSLDFGGRVQVAPAPDGATGSIWDRAVLLSLTFRRLGNSKKIQGSQYEVDGDKSMTTASKKLLDCKEYEAISSHDGETARYIAKRSSPSMFRAGVYMISIDLVEDLDSYLIRRMDERGLLVADLVRVYGSAVNDALSRLGSLGDIADYLSRDAVAAAYSMSYQWFEMGAPGRLGSISAAMMAREAEKAEAMAIALSSVRR